MDSNQLRDMHARISNGFPLTQEETRWLWNVAVEACNDPEYTLDVESYDASFQRLGEILRPKIRCERCNCTGTVHASQFLGSDGPGDVSCPPCLGTGFVERTKET